MTTPSTDHVLITTRESMHRAAEHLLAATRKRATGDITLVPASEGVRTPELPDGRVVELVGPFVVVRGAGVERRARLTTLADAGSAVGLEAGFPWSKHPPGTEFEPDAALEVDPAAAAALARWFLLGEAALAILADEIRAEKPTSPQIFPEHFDLGLTAGAVNYGFSPGDEALPTPYAYVGPHVLPRVDSFWNAPFGAYRTWKEISLPEHALAFFRAGRAQLGL